MRWKSEGLTLQGAADCPGSRRRQLPAADEAGRIFGVKLDWTPIFFLRDDPFKPVTASIVS